MSTYIYVPGTAPLIRINGNFTQQKVGKGIAGRGKGIHIAIKS